MTNRIDHTTPPPSPAVGDLYVEAATADHCAHCAHCCADLAAYDAMIRAYGESAARRDRIQLRLNIEPAVTA